ncbi:MAG: bifunctional diaminohydroxyphosphoribosylaminopyrimidine deaminase/5-amino-6-(5-phosphoribosylamino)uracil reductase RibD [Clostridia bacterium]|nr:bifunctional diaminohydroxyphosphoribosylaminopyrimidine deaminase/5-amino-6-(5-phosphoribosylamino)uracil reductase RibD [Clostridia bacterium]
MTDEKYMFRAIELAKLGEGRTNPNPLVGAVIVKNGKIIGEGYHMVYGDLHAERNAIKNCNEDMKGATIYVTLEPCCHYGKQPPCTDAIIEKGFSKVVIGSRDPNPLVSGKGVKKLRENGIEVIEDFLKDECDKINNVFFHFITTKTPYVVMKYAMTMDGKIATSTGKSKWISGEKSRKNVQKTRNRLFSIMAGIGTVLTDNPLLTCRIENGRNPVRIICDSSLRIPIESNILNTAKDVPTIIAYCHDNFEKEKKIKACGAKTIKISEKDGHIDLKELIKILGEEKIDSILLEGGGELNFSALKEGIVQEVQVYIAPKIFGGKAKSPVGGIGINEVKDAFGFKLTDIERFDEDVLLKFEAGGKS